MIFPLDHTVHQLNYQEIINEVYDEVVAMENTG